MGEVDSFDDFLGIVPNVSLGPSASGVNPHVGQAKATLQAVDHSVGDSRGEYGISRAGPTNFSSNNTFSCTGHRVPPGIPGLSRMPSHWQMTGSPQTVYSVGPRMTPATLPFLSTGQYTSNLGPGYSQAGSGMHVAQSTRYDYQLPATTTSNTIASVDVTGPGMNWQSTDFGSGPNMPGQLPVISVNQPPVTPEQNSQQVGNTPIPVGNVGTALAAHGSFVVNPNDREQMDNLFRLLQSERYPIEGESDQSDDEMDEYLTQGDRDLPYAQLVEDIKLRCPAANIPSNSPAPIQSLALSGSSDMVRPQESLLPLAQPLLDQLERQSAILKGDIPSGNKARKVFKLKEYPKLPACQASVYRPLNFPDMFVKRSMPADWQRLLKEPEKGAVQGIFIPYTEFANIQKRNAMDLSVLSTLEWLMACILPISQKCEVGTATAQDVSLLYRYNLSVIKALGELEKSAAALHAQLAWRDRDAHLAKCHPSVLMADKVIMRQDPLLSSSVFTQRSVSEVAAKLQIDLHAQSSSLFLQAYSGKQTKQNFSYRGKPKQINACGASAYFRGQKRPYVGSSDQGPSAKQPFRPSSRGRGHGRVRGKRGGSQ